MNYTKISQLCNDAIKIITIQTELYSLMGQNLHNNMHLQTKVDECEAKLLAINNKICKETNI